MRGSIRQFVIPTGLAAIPLILSLPGCAQPIAENWYGDWYYMPEDQSINITTYQTSLDVLDQQVTLSVDCDEDPLVRVGIHTDILSDFDGVSGQVTIAFDNGEPDAQYWRYWQYFTDDAYYKTSIVSQRPYIFVARLLEAERLTIHFRGTDDTTLSATWTDLRDFPAAYEALQRECPHALNPITL